MIYLTLILFPFVYALLFRMHGGGFFPNFPKKVTELLIAIPFGYLAYLVSGDNWYAAGFAFLAAFFMKMKGHGQYFNLDLIPPYSKRIEPETWDMFLTPLFGKDPRTDIAWEKNTPMLQRRLVDLYGLEKLWWRCYTGLVISGAMVSLGLVFSIGLFVSLSDAVLLFLNVGFVKGTSYAIGHMLEAKGVKLIDKELDGANEYGEVLTGFFTGLYLALFLFAV